MNFFRIFKEPFPYEPPPKGTLGTSVYFGLFIFVFLVIFKPFNLDEFSFYYLLKISFAYGLITFSCVFLSTSILPALFPSVFNEICWTTGKHILFITGTLFFVGLANYLLSPFLVGSKLTLYNAIWFQGITLAIGLIPIGLFSLVRQNQLLKRYSAEAKVLESKLKNNNDANGGKGIKEENPGNTNDANGGKDKKEKNPGNTNDDANKENDIKDDDPGNTNYANDETNYANTNKIVVSGDYHNEKVEVFRDDLYLVTSASNYIKLYHLQKEKLVYSIIRSTLKKAEPIILVYPNFFKCHRAYIINLDKVIHVEGNAQGYKLRIEGHDELIPVSRNLNTEFSDKLLAFRRE